MKELSPQTNSVPANQKAELLDELMKKSIQGGQYIKTPTPLQSGGSGGCGAPQPN